MLNRLSPLLPLLTLVAALAPIAAQSPATPAPVKPAPATPVPAAPEVQDPVRPPPVERTYRGAVDEAQSRDLFTACDSNADDRLDIFEAGSSLSLVRGAQDTEGFGRIDKDRDGFLAWPEFDQALRRALAGGGTMKARPNRALAVPLPEPRAATRLQQFLQMHDSNRNGGIDPGELDQFLRQANLPPGIASQLRLLDQDRSGRLEATELAPWLDRLAAPTPAAAPAEPAKTSSLPAPWGVADADVSNSIDEAELGRVLRHLDPLLGNWAAALKQLLDRNRDGVLQAAELTPDPASAVPVAPNRQLPSQSPVR
ncbi:MAG: hypothetical protein MUC36_16910 [Planctomycetes bacterium]|nr:hypothetical protein [Planctomycetota bacterium]